MHDPIRRLDLNLLLVLDALFRHRSVSAAADELAISPSACSHALSRLREALDDELFVRRGSAMRPTPKATHLADAVAQALAILDDRLGNEKRFSPKTSTQTIKFVATDFTAFALLPAVIARLERDAPHLRIEVAPSRHRDAFTDLTESGAHFALGFADEFSPRQEGTEALEAFTDEYVVVARRGHRRIKSAPTIEQYLAERHVVVKPWAQDAGVIDTALDRQGRRREIAVELSSVMTAPFIVANTQLLITLPRLVARRLEETAQTKIYPVPFRAPKYTLKTFYLRRHMNAPWHQWMRRQLLAVQEDLPA